MGLLAIYFVLLFAYSMCSGRLSRTLLTAPIVFTTAGVLVGLITPVMRGAEANQKLFLGIAEAGLVLTLFTDAARTDLRLLGSIRALPTRLLSTGMLLTIVLGAVAARLVFPGLTLWEAGILSAILAPTDAGLGQAIVSSPRVPARVREALNVEAGLNDGLSVPFMMLFIALAVRGTDGAGSVLMKYLVEQLGYGFAIGAVAGLAGGWLLGIARRRGWMSDSARQLGLVCLPVLCAFASEPAGASMFIAAFVAGLFVQIGFPEAGRHSVEFTEQWGQLLNFFVFFLLGTLVPVAWKHLTPALVLYAVLSLTVVRMLPVAVALIGSGLRRPTVLFMGMSGGAELRGAARQLAAGLRLARNEAVARQQEAVLTLDLVRRRFAVSGDPREIALPESLALHLYTAQSELLDQATGNIRFFPDGSSTGGAITVSGAKLAYRVNVDWLTGAIAIVEQDAQP